MILSQKFVIFAIIVSSLHITHSNIEHITQIPNINKFMSVFHIGNIYNKHITLSFHTHTTSCLSCVTEGDVVVFLYYFVFVFKEIFLPLISPVFLNLLCVYNVYL